MFFSGISTLCLLSSVTESPDKVNAKTPSSQVNSNASVTFKANDNTVGPVDPTNPDSNFTPDNPNKPSNQKGPLSIDFVSVFNFGVQDITTNDKTYNAALVTGKNKSDTDSVDKPNYVQVTDNTGESLGWKLSVKQLDQLKNNSDELKGAQIKLSNLEAITSSSSNAIKPTTNSNVILVPGNAVPITTAEKGQGEGTWVTRFGSTAEQGKESVQLFVPGASVKKIGAYTASLEWSLNKTPDNTVA